MNKAINRIEYTEGQIIGSCIFIKDDGKIQMGIELKRAAIFKCQCGKLFRTVIQEVKTGGTTSCGCAIIRKSKRSIPEIYINGKIRPEYYSWCAMRRRCYDKKSPDYKNWGERGIKVCERWNNSFLDFLADMGTKPSSKHNLDRFPNNDGDYEPGNARWATKREQGANTRKTRMIEYNGVSLSLSDWARNFNVTPAFLFRKLKSSLSTQDAFSKCIKNPPVVI